jgi:hypothetical protein
MEGDVEGQVEAVVERRVWDVLVPFPGLEEVQRDILGDGMVV